MELLRGPRWGLVVLGLCLLAFLGWGNGVGVQITSRVKAVTVLEYEGRLYEDGFLVPVRLTLSPEGTYFVGKVVLEVLSNTPWELRIYPVEFHVGDRVVRPERILLFWGERRFSLGVSSHASITEGRGVWSLELEIRVIVPPEADGSEGGKAELTLSLSVSGARP